MIAGNGSIIRQGGRKRMNESTSPFREYVNMKREAGRRPPRRHRCNRIVLANLRAPLWLMKAAGIVSLLAVVGRCGAQCWSRAGRAIAKNFIVAERHARPNNSDIVEGNRRAISVRNPELCSPVGLKLTMEFSSAT